jgi:hypothetical protein
VVPEVPGIGAGPVDGPDIVSEGSVVGRWVAGTLVVKGLGAGAGAAGSAEAGAWDFAAL